MIRVLIVDDERDSANELESKLTRLKDRLHDRIQVVGIAESYEQAREYLNRTPDLILLDNVLGAPNRQGHNFFNECILHTEIEVIFVTAQERDPSGYLAQDLWKHNITVLYKGEPDERFVTAINRFINERLEPNHSLKVRNIYDFIRNYANTPYAKKNLPLKGRFFELKDIVYIKSYGSSSIFYFCNDKPETSGYELADWEDKFEEKDEAGMFMKVSGNYILNLRYYKTLVAPSFIELKAHLIKHSGTDSIIKISKEAYSALKKVL